MPLFYINLVRTWTPINSQNGHAIDREASNILLSLDKFRIRNSRSEPILARIIKHMYNKRVVAVIKEILIKLLIIILILLGVLIKQDLAFSTFIGDLFANPMLWFLLSGLISGAYYAYNEDENNIWVITNEQGNKINKPFEKYPIQHKVQIYWVHLISGCIGSMCLFKFTQNIPPDLSTLNIVLFTSSLLGYMGLLPRAFWFLASTGNPFRSS